MLVAGLALALPTVGEAAETGSILGTVTAKVGGAPLEGVDVCAENSKSGACASTDRNGEYEIYGLPGGAFTVEFQARAIGYANQLYGAEVIVNEGASTTGIDAELDEAATISGTVSAADTGLPVANVEVCASTADESELGCGSSDSSGAYLIEGLGPGQYDVYFYAEETGQNLLSQPYELGSITLTAGMDRSGVDAALQTGGVIDGTVRAAATGAPLGDVDVCLTEANETYPSPLACLETPATGDYRFFGIWTGSFNVIFSPEANQLEEGLFWALEADSYPTQWWNGKAYFETATPIAVTAGATVGGIDGSLGPGPPVPPPTKTIIVPPTEPSNATPRPLTGPGPTTGAGPTTGSQVKPLKCKSGFVKKAIKGRPARCVKLHKPERHRGKHHPKPGKHAKD